MGSSLISSAFLFLFSDFLLSIRSVRPDGRARGASVLSKALNDRVPMKKVSLAVLAVLALSLTACSDEPDGSKPSSPYSPPSSTSASPTPSSQPAVGGASASLSSFSSEEQAYYAELEGALESLKDYAEEEITGTSYGTRTLDEEERAAANIELSEDIAFSYGGSEWSFEYPSVGLSISITNEGTEAKEGPRTFIYDGEAIRTPVEVGADGVSEALRTDGETFLAAAKQWYADNGEWPDLEQEFGSDEWVLQEYSFGFDDDEAKIEPRPIEMKVGLTGGYSGSGDYFEAEYRLDTFMQDEKYDTSQYLHVVGQSGEVTARYMDLAEVQS